MKFTIADIMLLTLFAAIGCGIASMLTLLEPRDVAGNWRSAFCFAITLCWVFFSSRAVWRDYRSSQ